MHVCRSSSPEYQLSGRKEALWLRFDSLLKLQTKNWILVVGEGDMCHKSSEFGDLALRNTTG
jgi:hypothetical protein